ncbi:DUF1800 domain-containing protein [Massilia sp. W12]|uniref:DUF1800 domain-containing protein n=1 Tax=Massilia sp. W12 TaxID=3126507 RepID=UPI0030CAA346
MRNFHSHLLAAFAATLLSACGGDTVQEQNSKTPIFSGSTSNSSAAKARRSSQTPRLAADPAAKKTASRFLAQASFGPTMSEIESVAQSGTGAWLEAQFNKPQTLHRTYLDQVAASLPPGGKLQQVDFFQSFWKQAATAPDPLRQRVTFALSEIFVVSFQNSVLTSYPRGVAAYYDMLGQHAFGNFRNLLEGVATHPMMGVYLSMLGNRKENEVSAPDENFAREIMQLFSIGLYELNEDGSMKLVNGAPVETYSHADIVGLSKALTGWSWAGPDKSDNRFMGYTADPDRDWKPMQNYPNWHSTSEKKFLGQTISGASSGEADLKIAIDTLFNHPNVGPFIGRQLIQRLVTSNPSPAYVQRVARSFNDNGAGVRGDMKATLRAIFNDPEAQGLDPANQPRKLREPIIRVTHWMRAFNVYSTSGRFIIGNIDDQVVGIGQNPLRSPSVFNFYRPGYVPPNTEIANAGLVAPEMQTTNEVTVAGYLNYMMDVVENGMGSGSVRDVLPDYSAELALSENTTQLLDRIDLLLLNGQMPGGLREQISSAINSVAIPAPNGSNDSAIALAKISRVRLGVFLAMASPEYIVQK